MFWLVGFFVCDLLPVSGLYSSLHKHMTEHHRPWAQLPTHSPKGASHFHFFQSLMVPIPDWLLSPFSLLQFCSSAAKPVTDDSIPFLLSQSCHHSYGAPVSALQHQLKLILFVICSHLNSVHSSTK